MDIYDTNTESERFETPLYSVELTHLGSGQRDPLVAAQLVGVALGVVLRSTSPFSVTIVTEIGGPDRPCCGYEISAPTAELARYGASMLCDALSAVDPIGRYTTRPGAITSTRIYQSTIGFAVAPEDMSPTTQLPGAFAVVKQRQNDLNRLLGDTEKHPQRWMLRVSLWSTRAVTTTDSAVATGYVAVGEATDGAPAFWCRVTLHGESPHVDVLAGLLAAEIGHSNNLHVQVEQEPSAAIVLPATTVGWLATVAHRSDEWSTTAAVLSPTRLFELVNSGSGGHFYVNGRTGQGKTSALVHLIDQGFQRHRTQLVIDPHGDMADWIAQRAIHHERRLHILRFGHDSQDRWNIAIPPRNIALTEWAETIAEGVQQSYHDMPTEYFGPVGTRLVQLVTRILVETPLGPLPPSYAEDLLADGEFTGRILAHTEPGLAAQFRRDVLTKLVHDANSLWYSAKFAAYATHAARSVYATSTNQYDLTDVANGTYSLVVSFEPGYLDQRAASTLAAAIIGGVILTAKRKRAPHPIDITIDEWYQMHHPVVLRILPEGRKFGIHARLAGQDLDQVSAQSRSALLTNCATIATFACGPNDANSLGGQYPTISATQLRTLPRYQFAIVHDGTDAVFAAPAPLQNGIALVQTNSSDDHYPGINDTVPTDTHVTDTHLTETTTAGRA